MRQQSLYIYLFSLFIILFSLLMVQVNEVNDQQSVTGLAASYQGVYAGDFAFAGEGKAITYEKRLRSLSPGQLYEIDVVKEGSQRELPFEKLEFTVKKRRREAIFSFRKGTNLPTSANAPPLGKVYSYGQIAIESPQDAGDALAYSDIENSAVTFSVDKKLLEVQNAKPSSVKLSYLAGEAWQNIPLSQPEETSYEYFYKAQVPVGIYALTYEITREEPKPVAPVGPVCGNRVVEAGENCQTCPSDVQCAAGQTCQAGVCVTPPAPVRQAPVQPVYQQPVVQQPQSSGSSIWIWILIPAIIVVLVLIAILIFRRPEEPEQGFDEFNQPASQQPPMAQQPQSMQPQVNQQPASQQPQPAQQANQQNNQQPWQQPKQTQQKPVQNNNGQNNNVDQHLQQVKDYINKVSQTGYKKDQIKSALVSKGWPANLVDKAFKELGK